MIASATSAIPIFICFASVSSIAIAFDWIPVTTFFTVVAVATSHTSYSVPVCTRRTAVACIRAVREIAASTLTVYTVEIRIGWAVDCVVDRHTFVVDSIVAVIAGTG